MKNIITKPVFAMAILISHASVLVNSQGLTITPGTNLVANGNVRLVINDGGFRNNGTFTIENGTVVFTGNTATSNSFIAGSGTTTFNHLTLNKTSNGIQLNRNIGVVGTLLFSSGDSLFLNGYTIDLGATGILSGETNTRRITGMNGGYIQVTQTLNAPLSINPGNLGAEITSSSNLGSTVIRRGHQQQSGASIYRYFDIIPANNSGLDATINFYYLETELSGVNEANLGMFSSSNGGLNWTNIGENGLEQTLNFVTKNGIDHLDRLTLSNISQPLAVHWLYLKARSVNRQVVLDWATANETSNNHFEVERSSDEKDFITLASLPGAGNSDNNQYYNYTDNNPLSGKNFYRIRQVDNDGRFTYSHTIVVNLIEKGNSLLNVYPNPAGSTVTLSFAAARSNNYLLQVHDMYGHVVQNKIVYCAAGLNEIEYDVSRLPAGIYTIGIPGSRLQWIQLIKSK